MSVSRRALFCIALLLLALSPLALAQGTYTQIDAPGSVNTYVFGVDRAGHLSGYYQDETNNYEHGFVLDGDTYTTIDYPGFQDTFLTGLNDLGQITGMAATGSAIGFVYSMSTHTFTEINYPGSDYTVPNSINNGGVVGGYFGLNSGKTIEGFELVGSTYSSIVVPGSSYTHVTGVSGAGKLFGYAVSPTSQYISFSADEGGVHRLLASVSEAVVLGVNVGSNALVGTYGGGGFIYQNKNLQTLQFPGATLTFPQAVNAAGEVVGWFQNPDGSHHGFTWTPDAPAEKK
jgi:probable HAF family extracellular repeat protein